MAASWEGKIEQVAAEQFGLDLQALLRILDRQKAGAAVSERKAGEIDWQTRAI